MRATFSDSEAPVSSTGSTAGPDSETLSEGVLLFVLGARRDNFRAYSMPHGVTLVSWRVERFSQRQLDGAEGHVATAYPQALQTVRSQKNLA